MSDYDTHTHTKDEGLFENNFFILLNEGKFTYIIISPNPAIAGHTCYIGLGFLYNFRTMSLKF